MKRVIAAVFAVALLVGCAAKAPPANSYSPEKGWAKAHLVVVLPDVEITFEITLNPDVDPMLWPVRIVEVKERSVEPTTGVEL